MAIAESDLGKWIIKLSCKRIIARLDIKGENVIKGIQMEGLRIIGDPNDLANKYYESGADEIVFMDTVASLYRRESILKIIEKASENVFIPITVGGGIRSIDNAKQLFSSGADKVAINSAAVLNPSLITEIAKHFGSQSVVVSIEAKLVENGWEVYINNGREPTGINVGDWIEKLQGLGAGEVILSSVDRDGTKKGMDIELLRQASERCQLPIVAASGVGSLNDVVHVFDRCGVEAVAIGSALHSGVFEIADVKRALQMNGMEARYPG